MTLGESPPIKAFDYEPPIIVDDLYSKIPVPPKPAWPPPDAPLIHIDGWDRHMIDGEPPPPGVYALVRIGDLP